MTNPMSEADWHSISELYTDFIIRKIDSHCGDVRREIDECFVNFIEEELQKEFSEEDSAKITEMALYWFEEDLTG